MVQRSMLGKRYLRNNGYFDLLINKRDMECCLMYDGVFDGEGVFLRLNKS